MCLSEILVPSPRFIRSCNSVLQEPLHGRNFTFWEWFYSILKLTKDWLQGPWKEKSDIVMSRLFILKFNFFLYILMLTHHNQQMLQISHS